MRIVRRAWALSLCCVATSFLSAVAVAAADTLITTEVQITNTPSTHETTPTLGFDGANEWLVFTRNQGSLGRIIAQRIDSLGNPVGSALNVSDAAATPGTDDRLNDISGNNIVFTAFDPMNLTQALLYLYDLSTGASRRLTTMLSPLREARIHGDHVVWVAGLTGATRIYYLNLSWPPEIGPVVVDDPQGLGLPPSAEVAIGSDLIVYTELTSEFATALITYNLTTGRYDVVDTVSGGPLVPARVGNAETSGDWVVYEHDDGTNLSIIAKQIILTPGGGIASTQIIDTGLPLSALRRPAIDGDHVVYESRAAGDFEILLHRLSDQSGYQVTNDLETQGLSTIYGDKVAYLDYRSGMYADIWLSTLTFVSNEPVTLAAVDSGRYSSTGFHDPAETEYLAAVGSTRNFFVFDLTSVSDPRPIVSASLVLDTGTVTSGGFGGITHTLYDVSTAIPTLVAGGDGLTAIYADLSAGVPFSAATEIEPGTSNTDKSIPLLPAGIAAVEAARGGLVAIGGAPTGLSGNFAFDGTDVSGARLVISFVTPVPSIHPIALYTLVPCLLVAMGLVATRRRT